MRVFLLSAAAAALLAGGAAAQPAAPAAPKKDPAPAAGPSVTTPSGARVETLVAGTGASPAATDRVRVHYTGKLTDGKVFDSSVQRGQPATFPLNGVIRCWTEGLQTMKVGGKARLTCPPAIAYGAAGRPPVIPPNSTLVFDVELLEIVK